MVLNTGAVISILILAGCAAAVLYVWYKSHRWLRDDHSRPMEKDPRQNAASRDTDKRDGGQAGPPSLPPA
jgi:hypothetical protein